MKRRRPRGSARAAGPARIAVAAAALTLCALESSARDRGADGQFSKRSSSHFVLYQDVDLDRASGWRGSDRFERDVLAVLESAHDQLDAALDLRPPRPITVLVYDPEIFDAQFAGLFRFAAAGFYRGDIRVRGDTRVTVRLTRVLHHELVHAAFDAVAPSIVLPAWVNEGVAEWFEARTDGKRRLSAQQRAVLENAAQRGALLPLAALSRPNFAHLGPETAGLAYLQSYALIEHLVRGHGERDLRRFTAELVRTGDLDRTLARVFRTDQQKLERALARELR